MALVGAVSFAQETSTKPAVDFSAGIQTSNLWRGLIVTDKPIVTVLTSFNLDQEGKFKVGTWGGMAISNNEGGSYYKEIDVYVQYSSNGFTIGLWDLFNSTANTGANYWTYKKENTGHLLDLRLGYEVNKFSAELDVLLHGSGDTQHDGFNNKGEIKVKQRYSSYLQFAYNFDAGNNVSFKPFVGVGFALNGDTHLYGNGENKFDFTNVGFTVSKTVALGNYKLPLSATTLWNPSQKYARVQLAATLF